MHTPRYSGRDWVSPNIPHWLRWFSEYIDKPIAALTVGNYEGRADRWLLENILTHLQSHLTCIDPFTNAYYASLTDGPVDGLEATFKQAYTNFLYNTNPWVGRVRLLREPSYLAFSHLPPTEHFDFIYIDGAHLARIVLEDSVAAWQRLKPNGLLVWDDYRWRAHSNYLPPKPAIDAFLTIYDGYWCDREYAKCQVKIRKIK